MGQKSPQECLAETVLVKNKHDWVKNTGKGGALRAIVDCYVCSRCGVGVTFIPGKQISSPDIAAHKCGIPDTCEDYVVHAVMET